MPAATTALHECEDMLSGGEVLDRADLVSSLTCGGPHGCA